MKLVRGRGGGGGAGCCAFTGNYFALFLNQVVSFLSPSWFLQSILVAIVHTQAARTDTQLLLGGARLASHIVEGVLEFIHDVYSLDSCSSETASLLSNVKSITSGPFEQYRHIMYPKVHVMPAPAFFPPRRSWRNCTCVNASSPSPPALHSVLVQIGFARLPSSSSPTLHVHP